MQKWYKDKLRRTLIWGTGPVGLSFTYFAKLLGAYPVIVCGRRDDALADAISMGADFTINIRSEDVAEKIKTITQGQRYSPWSMR